MQFEGRMARPLRVEYPGAANHVRARGNQGRALFKADPDRRRFLETLAEACAKTGWRIDACVLMGNHLLVETPENCQFSRTAPFNQANVIGARLCPPDQSQRVSMGGTGEFR